MDALKHEHDSPDTSQETGGRLELGSRASERSLGWRWRDNSGLARNSGLLRNSGLAGNRGLGGNRRLARNRRLTRDRRLDRDRGLDRNRGLDRDRRLDRDRGLDRDRRLSRGNRSGLHRGRNSAVGERSGPGGWDNSSVLAGDTCWDNWRRHNSSRVVSRDRSRNQRMGRRSSSGHDHWSLGVQVNDVSGSHGDCLSQSDRNSQSLGSRSDFRVGNCDKSIRHMRLKRSGGASYLGRKWSSKLSSW
jgi:hypothetical protein